MSFLSDAYRYKESSERGHLEDFTTEVLCELFRAATREGAAGALLSQLFPDADLPQNSEYKLEWKTQHYIGEGPEHALGKRPDLVGEGEIGGKKAFLLFEHKIDAGFGFHQLDDGEMGSQLKVYSDYLDGRREEIKQLFVISRGGQVDSEHHDIPEISWMRVWEIISGLKGKPYEAAPVSRYLGQELGNFLEENGMSGVTVQVQDIVAYQPWQNLKSLCEKYGMGNTWRLLQNDPIRKKLESSGLQVTHGNRYGGWAWSNRKTNTTIFTPGDSSGNHLNADHSNVIFYSGVLLDGLWSYIYPKHEGVPSFGTGFAIYLNREVKEKNNGFLKDVMDALNDGDSDSDSRWILNEYNAKGEAAGWEDEKKYIGINISCQLSFFEGIQVHKWGNEWNEQPDQFFRGTYKDVDRLGLAMLKELVNLHETVE